MKKKILLPLTAVFALGGGLVSYLDYFDHETAPVLRVDSPTRHHPTAVLAFGAMPEARWDYHRMPASRLPFYAGSPVAAGLRHFELTRVLDAPQSGTPVPEDKLARVEIVVPQGPMLPQPNTDLRWHAWLDQTAKQDVGNITESLGTPTGDQGNPLANTPSASH
jgi:cytochrome c peroxidase